MSNARILFAALVATLAAPGAVAQNVTAWRSPECGCCHRWAQTLEAAGMHVKMIDADDMAAVKKVRGVPETAASCHTATVEGYTIEGHVPAREIKRLLAERPDAVGLSAPGMPLGSPGMDGGTRPVRGWLLGRERDDSMEKLIRRDPWRGARLVKSSSVLNAPRIA